MVMTSLMTMTLRQSERVHVHIITLNWTLIIHVQIPPH